MTSPTLHPPTPASLTVDPAPGGRLSAPVTGTPIQDSIGRALDQTLARRPADARGAVVLTGTYADGVGRIEAGVSARLIRQWELGVWGAYDTAHQDPSFGVRLQGTF